MEYDVNLKMDLSQLASLLRENGDQVLNGLSKLSLSTKLLKELNESFGLIVEEREALSSTFQVISTSNSKVELLLDLQFLHDFIQRTVGLKLIEDSPESCDLVSINKFKNLKLLEIHKVPISQIVGLQSLRTQLQYIICMRSLNSLKDLFTSCGGDKTQGFVWSELKEAVLTYNNLETIDNSFEFVPWLQTLDLSHNSINNAQSIDCLPNLKYLNIGFNYLESIPIFKKELFRNLQILILKSNYIGELTGLLYIDNLVTLDLSCNCLVDHHSLAPLVHLVALQWLNLEGNPLSFHPNHRSITVGYLHSNTSTVKFILDRQLLSKVEKKQIGCYSSKFVISEMRREHLSSICSNLSELTNSSEITQIAASDLTRSQSTQKKKIRDAVISEEFRIADDEEIVDTPEMVESQHSLASLSTSNTDHFETQKKIQDLRDQFGEDWLKHRGGSLMQDILGMEKFETPELASTPYEEDFMKHAADVFVKSAPEKIVAAIKVMEIEKPDVNNQNKNVAVTSEVEIERSDVNSETSANNTFMTASETFYDSGDEADFEGSSENTEDLDHDSDDEVTGHTFLAHIQRTNSANIQLEPEEIFIVITEKYIKERDPLTAKIKYKWLAEAISSCEIISKNPSTIHLEFDTVRRNMKERIYILEDEEAQRLNQAVSNILSQKPLSVLLQTIYCCMKCSTQFSWDPTAVKIKTTDNPDNLPMCPNPNCSSTLVYELEEDSTPTNHTLVAKNGFKHRDKSETADADDCSIASETESSQVAQIRVTAELHVNRLDNKIPTVATNRSAASVQESTSSHTSVDDNPSENHFKKYESDIEVISNPSQSSIEVLDDQFRPGRKRSSEERRTIIAPSLQTIPDITGPIAKTATGILQNLTESSSSSSFTESVCTAYETHTPRPSSGLSSKSKQTIQEEKEEEKNIAQKQQPLKDEKNKSSLITSLFEGLFSGPTTGTKSGSSKNTVETIDDIKFDFGEDFSNVDHRVKYHLYQHIFEDEHENFVWLVRCVLISAGYNEALEGCIALSTYRIYFLNIKEHDSSEELATWLVKKDSYSIDRLQAVYTLPWKQGIGLEIRGTAKKQLNYLCVLQDMQRTSNFLAFLASNPLPDSCDIECDRPMMNLQQLLLSYPNSSVNKDTSLLLFSMFNKCTITNNDKSSLKLGALIVTPADLIILSDVLWLLPDAERIPKISTSQPISNLLEVETEGLTLDFHFFDEVAGCEEIWHVQWVTTECVNTVLSAVKPPWEEIFLVPLQVNQKVHSE